MKTLFEILALSSVFWIGALKLLTLIPVVPMALAEAEFEFVVTEHEEFKPEIPEIRVPVVPPEPVEEQELTTYHDLDSAHRESQATGNPMLTIFTGPNCPYCRGLEQGALSDDTVKEYLTEHYVFAMIDGDKYPETVKAFRVTKYPTAFIYTLGAKSMERFTPPGDPSYFLSELGVRE